MRAPFTEEARERERGEANETETETKRRLNCLYASKIYTVAAAPCAIRSFQKAWGRSPLRWTKRERKRAGEREKDKRWHVRCVCGESRRVVLRTILCINAFCGSHRTRYAIHWTLHERSVIRRGSICRTRPVACTSRRRKDHRVVGSCALYGDKFLREYEPPMVKNLSPVTIDVLGRRMRREP